MKKLRLMSKTRRAWQGGSHGFSMLEVVIAMALLGIIAVSVLAALQTAALALINADRRATAESIARTQMEYVRFSEYDGELGEGHPEYSSDPQIDGIKPPDFSVVTTAIRLDPDNDGDSDDDGIQQITVTVSHQDQVLVTLEDFKRK